MKGIETPATKTRAGMLESAIQKLFARSAEVIDVEDVGPVFRIVTLGGDALRNVEWTPGDKIQIQFGGWVQRTYTPMDWDAVSGRTRILVYLHGDGPGTLWARSLTKGAACLILGPRKSIRLVRPQCPIVLFGDETSLGLAASLSNQVSPQAAQKLFEISTLGHTMPVIERLRLHDAHVCVRLPGEGHFTELETRMAALLQAQVEVDIVLTGKAGSIRHLSRSLQQRGTDAGRRQSKAYWAPGKTGLD
jgi:NADPH-dependent ferric siderophore reductase